MKKMFTLLLSLMAFSALFAQYDRSNDNRNYNNHNGNYNGGNYGVNNGNFSPEHGAMMHHDNDNFQPYGHREDFDRRDGFHRDHDFGFPDRFHARDDWKRYHHRGLGVLGTGLLIGGAIGIAIAAHH